MFVEKDEGFIDVTNFDASEGSQDGFDESDFVRGKGDHTRGFI